MTPRNLLRALIATIGFIGCGYGILYVLDALLFSFGLDLTASSSQHAKYYAVRGLAEVLIGYWIMQSAGRLAEITFPPHEDEEEPYEEGADDNGVAPVK